MLNDNFSLRPGEKGDWIPALEAVHLISAKVGGDKKAKSAIIHRLQDGAVNSTALWLAHSYDVGVPYLSKSMAFNEEEFSRYVKLSKAEQHDLWVEHTKPKISHNMGPEWAQRVDSGDLMIGGAFWKMGTAKDRDRWDWALGLFVSAYMSPEEVRCRAIGQDFRGPGMRMVAFGVHFHKPDILNIVGSPEPVAAPKVASNAGRKRSELWPRWIAEVIILHEDEGIERLTANALVEKVRDRVSIKGGDIPTERTVFETAKEILEFLKAARANL